MEIILHVLHIILGVQIKLLLLHNLPFQRFPKTKRWSEVAKIISILAIADPMLPKVTSTSVYRSMFIVCEVNIELAVGQALYHKIFATKILRYIRVILGGHPIFVKPTLWV